MSGSTTPALIPSYSQEGNPGMGRMSSGSTSAPAAGGGLSPEVVAALGNQVGPTGLGAAPSGALGSAATGNYSNVTGPNTMGTVGGFVGGTLGGLAGSIAGPVGSIGGGLAGKVGGMSLGQMLGNSLGMGTQTNFGVDRATALANGAAPGMPSTDDLMGWNGPGAPGMSMSNGSSPNAAATAGTNDSVGAHGDETNSGGMAGADNSAAGGGHSEDGAGWAKGGRVAAGKNHAIGALAQVLLHHHLTTQAAAGRHPHAVLLEILEGARSRRAGALR